MKAIKYGDVNVQRECIQTADGVELSITKLSAQRDGLNRGTVVLFHGNWTNNSFWLSKKGIGLAKHLSEEGFAVWMPEFRGHGQSPKGKKYYEFDAIQQIEFDVPAILERANAANPDYPVHIVGHSYGGVKVFAAMSAGFVNASQIGKICTLGSQVSFGYPAVKFPPIELFLRILLPAIKELPAKRLGMGPENEPAGTLLDYIRWKKRGGIWADKEGNSYWTGLQNIKNQCLLIAGRGDRSEPPRGCKMIYDALGSADKAFLELSKENGNKADYGHTELIISPEAREEVWPMISEWLLSDKASKV